MINHDKITTTKVAQRLCGRRYSDISTPLAMPDFYGDEIKYRLYEINTTDDAGKLYLSYHHLRNALVKIDRCAELVNAEKPVVVLGGNNTLDFKYMSQHFFDDMNRRMIPALEGLREFTTPPNEVALDYQKITSKYEQKVAAVKLMFPSGKGCYKSSYKALMPHFKNLLADLRNL